MFSKVNGIYISFGFGQIQNLGWSSDWNSRYRILKFNKIALSNTHMNIPRSLNAHSLKNREKMILKVEEKMIFHVVSQPA